VSGLGTGAGEVVDFGDERVLHTQVSGGARSDVTRLNRQRQLWFRVVNMLQRRQRDASRSGLRTGISFCSKATDRRSRTCRVLPRIAVYGRKLPRMASCGNFLSACYFGVTGELDGWNLMGKKSRPS
jgi:hypothetical protein